MKMNLRSLAAVVAVSVVAAATPATASDTRVVPTALAGEDNAEQRINFSGKLRMLSQRIPSAACHLSRGIDTEGAGKLLVAAPAEFEKILTALEFGDPDLNIQNAETKKKTIFRIHELREKWEPLKAAADAIAAGTGTDADVNYILTHNMEVLGAAQNLVSTLVKQYSNPNAVPFASLMLVDISGRQRMLTQKMSKESCMMATPHKSDSTIDDLAGTMQIFEASLEALRFGMAEVGINPPPNGQISEGLNVVVSDWSGVKPAIEAVLAGAELGDDTEATKFQGLNTTMANMNKVVGMYAAASKPAQ